MENKPKLLIVDDEDQIREIMEARFKRHGYNVLTANSGERAVTVTKESSPDIILLDKRMPGIDGVAALEAIRQFNLDVKVIMISGDEVDSDMESVIKKLNIAGYLHKPIIVTELDAMVEKVSL